MNEALGAWANAPLAYVLAEVRTEQLADLKEYRSKLGARFRGEYPIQRTLQSARFVATNSGLQHIEPDQEGAWEFATPENNVAVIVRAHGIVLHATKYSDSEEFLGRLQRAVNVLAEEVPTVYVNRLGLRYVDFIIPEKGETPEDYVDKRLNPSLDLAKAPGNAVAMSLAVYPMMHGRLALRFVRSSGLPELPPELATFSLEKSPLMKRERVSADQPTATIDTDRVREFGKPEPLDATKLMDEFRTMHADVSQAFRSLITPHARKKWGAK
jgi:uncharacterized protein (TIGR04255 family)